MNRERILPLLMNLGFWFFVSGMLLGSIRKLAGFTALALTLSILFFLLAGLGYLIKKVTALFLRAWGKRRNNSG